MEITTQSELPPDALKAVLSHLVSCFEKRGLVDLDVMYGWNCRDVSQRYQEVQVQTCDLETFIEQAGGCELWITSPIAKITLCHEGDIHFIDDDEEFVAEVKAFWLKSNWG